MSTVAKFLLEIEAFCRFAGVSESAFSKAVANDGKFVSRLRDGSDLTVGTLDRARRYMVDRRAAIAAERAERRQQPRKKAA